MAALSLSYVILVTLVQNVFYVYTPFNVREVKVMIDTKDYPTNNTWLPMNFEMIDNRRTPISRIAVPSMANELLRYKVRFLFRDNTVGETDWRTLIQTYKNTSILQQNVNSTSSSIEPAEYFISTIFGLCIYLAVVCTILLINFISNVTTPIVL